MKNCITYICIIACIITVAISCSTGHYHFYGGHVYDASTDLPLENVNLTSFQGTEVYTDNTGKYYFTEVRPDFGPSVSCKANICFEKVGYELVWRYIMYDDLSNDIYLIPEN